MAAVQPTLFPLVVPRRTPKVLGVDPSCTCLGVAGDGWTDVVKTKPQRKSEIQRDFVHRRHHHILAALGEFLTGVDLVVIEGLAMSPKMDKDRKLAWLNWSIRDLCWSRGVPYAVVSPSGLKLFALGSGRRTTKQVEADEAEGKSVKDPVLDVVRNWFPHLGDVNSDEADAAVLQAMGRQWLGSPVVEVSAVQLAALDGVAWPAGFDAVEDVAA